SGTRAAGVRDCRSVTWLMSVITPTKNTTLITATAGRTRASGVNASATGIPVKPTASDGPTPNRVVTGLTTARPTKAPTLLSVSASPKRPGVRGAGRP